LLPDHLALLTSESDAIPLLADGLGKPPSFNESISTG
jgi:hypothetical protein